MASAINLKSSTNNTASLTFSGSSDVSVDIKNLNKFDALGNVLLSDSTSTGVSSVSDGELAVFDKKVSGRDMLHTMDSNNIPVPLQSSFAYQRVMEWMCLSGSTTINYFGISAATAQGTATASTTGTYYNYKRLNYVSAATAGSLCGLYWTTINGALACQMQYGFFFTARVQINNDAATVSGARAFVGLSSSVAAATNVEPSTLTNCIGIAQLSTDATQLYVVYGGSAAQTAIATGIAITTGNSYDLSIYSPVGSTNTVYITVQNLEAGTSYSTTLTGTAGTALPTNSTSLLARAWRCNNATALACTIGVSQMYLETN